MEAVIITLACLIFISTCLKTGFLPMKYWFVIGAGYAIWTWIITPWVAGQPGSWLTNFLADRQNALNLSVCITLEATLLVAFCFESAGEGKQGSFRRIAGKALAAYPGFLLAGVIPYAIQRLMVLLPGFDFTLMQWTAALATLVMIPLGTWLLKFLGGKQPQRLEMIFILNLFIVILTVILTGK